MCTCMHVNFNNLCSILWFIYHFIFSSPSLIKLNFKSKLFSLSAIRFNQNVFFSRKLFFWWCLHKNRNSWESQKIYANMYILYLFWQKNKKKQWFITKNKFNFLQLFFCFCSWLTFSCFTFTTPNLHHKISYFSKQNNTKKLKN